MSAYFSTRWTRNPSKYRLYENINIRGLVPDAFFWTFYERAKNWSNIFLGLLLVRVSLHRSTPSSTFSRPWKGWLRADKLPHRGFVTLATLLGFIVKVCVESLPRTSLCSSLHTSHSPFLFLLLLLHSHPPFEKLRSWPNCEHTRGWRTSLTCSPSPTHLYALIRPYQSSLFTHVPTTLTLQTYMCYHILAHKETRSKAALTILQDVCRDCLRATMARYPLLSEFLPASFPERFGFEDNNFSGSSK